jgi:transcriptional antiterminator NusG
MNSSVAKWYILHIFSGQEKSVVSQIKEKLEKKGLGKHLEDIYVPLENVIEVRKGVKTETKKSLLPGYILVKVELNDDVWQVIRSIDKVGGFLGGKKSKPLPLMQKEVDKIFKQVEEGSKALKNKVEFNIGEEIKITEGPFESFIGTVEEIDEQKNLLKISVSIFGRATPVELNFSQVEKTTN